MQLSDEDRAVLDFARDPHPDDTTMRQRWGSPVRFYQRLARVLEDPAALAAEPQLVYQLRAIRDARSANYAARHL
jgi:hypothetical protein